MLDAITSLKKIYTGKVRDLYDIDSATMLMVASDRLSTFDIILNQIIPNKGIYLTQISLFWFNYLSNISNHLTHTPLHTILHGAELEYATGRAVIVHKLKPLAIEVIIRGYLAGTGYSDYLRDGAICGIKLPPNLNNAEQLPQPIFTPSTKAAIGAHDQNITIQQCKDIVGNERYAQIEQCALEMYNQATRLALTKGIIIADTKFEFGLDADEKLYVMDEILTPDSSRFWDKTTYTIGKNPDGFDKQFVRDYLIKDLKWNKEPPIPDLPPSVIQQTQDKYYEMVQRLGINTHIT